MADKTLEQMTDAEFDEYVNSVKAGGNNEDNEPHDEETTPQDNEQDNDVETSIENPDNSVDDESQDNEQSGDKEQPKTFTQAEVDKIIGKRLAEERTRHSSVDGLADEAIKYYGGDRESALSQLLTDLRGQNADKQGVNREEYSKYSEIERKAKLYDEQEALREQRDKQADELREKWKQGEEELQAIYPEFSFDTAMNNTVFRDAIFKGMSVPMAYMLMNKSEKPKSTRQSIRQNAQNTVNNGKAGEITEDTINKMSEKDFDRYVESIRKRE